MPPPRTTTSTSAICQGENESELYLHQLHKATLYLPLDGVSSMREGVRERDPFSQGRHDLAVFLKMKDLLDGDRQESRARTPNPQSNCSANRDFPSISLYSSLPTHAKLQTPRHDDICYTRFAHTVCPALGVHLLYSRRASKEMLLRPYPGLSALGGGAE